MDRRALGALLLILIVTLATPATIASADPPAASSPPATAVPGGPPSVFDPTSVGWVSYRNQSSAGFHDTYLARRATYLPTDLDIDTEDDYEVGSVWQRNTDDRSWRVKRNLTSAAYKAYWQKQKEAGFRPSETETYRDGGRKWAGLWVENVEGYGWASYRGQTASELEDTIDAQRAKGRMPIDFDEYLVDGKRRYASVWVTSTVRSWRLHRDRTESQWEDIFEKNSDDGYRVLAFESLEIDDQQRYGAIWVTNDNGRRWAARRDMSSKTFGNWWYRYRDLGYRLVGYNRYQTDDGERYAGVWRQNSERPNWPLRTQVDTLVADALEDDGVPGIGVAVYVDGTPVYLRGFGEADDDDNIWMDSTHVNSTASVSKAVAGVLTFRLMEQDPDLDLGDVTEDWVPAMPNHHTHTVGQLLSNRGCVGHYPELGSFSGDYDTARDASEEFWDEDLVCDPTTDDEDNYSTHGYTFLGAALEAAAGDDIKALVRDELVVPFGLGTLRTQRSTGHRMSLYDDGDEIDPSNNDWKVLGGGIESSTADLARFGAMLADGQILSRTSFATMWTPPTPASGYAFGWSTGTFDGMQVVAKNGAQDGVKAYLRIYPTEDIAVAVLMNDRAGDPVGLGRDVGNLVATSLVP